MGCVRLVCTRCQSGLGCVNNPCSLLLKLYTLHVCGTTSARHLVFVHHNNDTKTFSIQITLHTHTFSRSRYLLLWISWHMDCTEQQACLWIDFTSEKFDVRICSVLLHFSPFRCNWRVCVSISLQQLFINRMIFFRSFLLRMNYSSVLELLCFFFWK